MLSTKSEENRDYLVLDVAHEVLVAKTILDITQVLVPRLLDVWTSDGQLLENVVYAGEEKSGDIREALFSDRSGTITKIRVWPVEYRGNRIIQIRVKDV